MTDFRVGEEEGMMRVSKIFLRSCQELDEETPPVKIGRQ